MSELPPNPKFYNVLYDKKSRLWTVKIDNEKEALLISANKDLCIREAMRLAKECKSDKRAVLIRSVTGEILQRLDYP
jgi:hypothetical protein